MYMYIKRKIYSTSYNGLCLFKKNTGYFLNIVTFHQASHFIVNLRQKEK